MSGPADHVAPSRSWYEDSATCDDRHRDRGSVSCGRARVKTANGIVEGVDRAERHPRLSRHSVRRAADRRSAMEAAAAGRRTGTASAAPKQFGPRCMQRPIFGDMVFRSNGMSEDCLYLNVWTPAKSASERLPVLVYFYGGGFVAGDGSEPRYDGESMATEGHRRGDGQLPAGRLRLPRASGTDEGVAASRVRQLRAARSERRAAVGAAEHRGVRRRSEEGDDRRRVGRFDRRSARRWRRRCRKT